MLFSCLHVGKFQASQDLAVKGSHLGVFKAGRHVHSQLSNFHMGFRVSACRLLTNLLQLRTQPLHSFAELFQYLSILALLLENFLNSIPHVNCQSFLKPPLRCLQLRFQFLNLTFSSHHTPCC